MVRVLESTQGRRGVHWYTAALAVLPSSPGLWMFGELRDKGKWVTISPPRRFEILQAPARARCQMASPKALETFKTACIDTKNATRATPTSNWSLRTAVVSFFLSPFQARLRKTPRPDALRGHWAVPPICTSVCIEAWQRFLLASAATDAQGCDSIIDVVPCRADRTLPRTFLQLLKQRGWRRVTDLPLFFVPCDVSPQLRPSSAADETALASPESDYLLWGE